MRAPVEAPHEPGAISPQQDDGLYKAQVRRVRSGNQCEGRLENAESSLLRSASLEVVAERRPRQPGSRTNLLPSRAHVLPVASSRAELPPSDVTGIVVVDGSTPARGVDDDLPAPRLGFERGALGKSESLGGRPGLDKSMVVSAELASKSPSSERRLPSTDLISPSHPCLDITDSLSVPEKKAALSEDDPIAVQNSGSVDAIPSIQTDGNGSASNRGSWLVDADKGRNTVIDVDGRPGDIQSVASPTAETVAKSNAPLPECHSADRSAEIVPVVVPGSGDVITSKAIESVNGPSDLVMQPASELDPNTNPSLEREFIPVAPSVPPHAEVEEVGGRGHPIYISDDEQRESADESDVEFVDEHLASEVISENVKTAMEQLHLRNVAVVMPHFMRRPSASADDKAIMQGITDVLKVERVNRKKNAPHFSNIRGCILVVASNAARARRFLPFMQQFSNLSVAMHGVGKTVRERRAFQEMEGRSLDDVIGHVDVVVTLDRTAVQNAGRRKLSLRRVFLLLLDSIEGAWRRASTMTMLMRDYYRSLPEVQRPRVLGICLHNITAAEMPPIEFNLYTKFLPSSDSAAWPSSLGNGPRRLEHEFLDVEFVTYRNDVFQTEHRRAVAKPRIADRSAFSPTDIVVDQIGALGVTLYRKRKAIKERRKMSNHGLGDERKVRLRVSDENVTLGLTEKMLSLVNEIYEAYRASTHLDSLMTIIHAGKPIVACAMCEVIKALPIFENLVVRVVLGRRALENNRSASGKDNLEMSDWQGEDTDDEEVSDFICAETNVLIVADSYLQQDNRRPLPPCPLVMRYDGSRENAKMDGGGGRCRVIIFREGREGQRKTVLLDGKETESDVGKPSLNRSSTTGASEGVALRHGSHDDATDSVRPGNAGPSVIEKTSKAFTSSAAHTHKRPPQRAPCDKHERRNAEAGRTELYLHRPPKALLGPKPGSSEKVFLYRPLVFASKSLPEVFLFSNVLRIGVEDFVIVLSRKLEENDLVVSLKDFSNGTGHGSSITGFVKLDYQGAITLTDDRLEMARKYNARIFSLIKSEKSTLFNFNWDSDFYQGRYDNDRTGEEFLRRYLILPTVACEPELVRNSFGADEVKVEAEECDVQADAFDRKCVFNKYFHQDGLTIAPIPNPISVDWIVVENMLSLCDHAKHDEVWKKESPLAPNEFECLEGKLLFSTMPHETALLSGRLDAGFTPLSSIERSRKFSLNNDGTLVPQDDLAFATDMVATKKVLRQQEATTGLKKLDVIDVDGPESSPPKDKDDGTSKRDPPSTDGSSEPIPVRWCVESKKLVPHDSTKGNDNVQKKLFDNQRNVLKKRRHWTGSVRYTLEHYYSRFFEGDIKELCQPVLNVGCPQFASFGDFVDLLNGMKLTDLCERLVRNSSNQRQVIPELGHVYPLSIGVLFLPSLLFHVEQHVSICEMRKKLDPHIGVTADIGQLVRAVTPSHVNSTSNYERLEFLGDSILKLTVTLRLMVQYPRHPEGFLSPKRSHLVSNVKLKKHCVDMELYNYFRFQTGAVAEWTPPGTDGAAKENRFHMKGLADVMEALCGLYCLFGARSHEPRSDKRARLEAGAKDSDNDTAGECLSGVEWIYNTDVENEGEEGGNSSTDGMRDVTKSRKRKRNNGVQKNTQRWLTPKAISRGYETGYKFLERCSAVEGMEPTHRDVLLSAVHSLQSVDQGQPTDLTFRSFPGDLRLTSPKTKWEEQFGPLEEAIGYKFKRRPFLMSALTHASYLKPEGNVGCFAETFERLEFLGDAVADYCVVCYLYEMNPELQPGELTNLKGNVVSNESFARISVTHGFHKFLYHSSAAVAADIETFLSSIPQDLTKGGSGSHSGLKRNFGEIAAPKILGDVFEAIIGAVFVDSGLEQAWKVCMRLLKDSLKINADPERNDMHPCDELKSRVVHSWKLCSRGPSYETKSRPGPRKGIVCYVKILGETIATGNGSVTKRAKLTAASAALTLLKDENPESHGARLLAQLKKKSLTSRVTHRRRNS